MNSDPDAPMDTQLLQLERELFSLTPMETPRHLASRLDRELLGPVCIGRQVPASAKVVPFAWRRIVVPAAAAIVVVSVLNHLDQPARQGSGIAQSNPGRSARLPAREGAMETPTSYVLRAEPVLISPGAWQGMEYQYFIQPGAGPAAGFNALQRHSGLSPVAFH